MTQYAYDINNVLNFTPTTTTTTTPLIFLNSNKSGVGVNIEYEEQFNTYLDDNHIFKLFVQPSKADKLNNSLNIKIKNGNKITLMMDIGITLSTPGMDSITKITLDTSINSTVKSSNVLTRSADKTKYTLNNVKVDVLKTDTIDYLYKINVTTASTILPVTYVLDAKLYIYTELFNIPDTIYSDWITLFTNDVIGKTQLLYTIIGASCNVVNNQKYSINESITPKNINWALKNISATKKKQDIVTDVFPKESDSIYELYKVSYVGKSEIIIKTFNKDIVLLLETHYRLQYSYTVGIYRHWLVLENKTTNQKVVLSTGFINQNNYDEKKKVEEFLFLDKNSTYSIYVEYFSTIESGWTPFLTQRFTLTPYTYREDDTTNIINDIVSKNNTLNNNILNIIKNEQEFRKSLYASDIISKYSTDVIEQKLQKRLPVTINIQDKINNILQNNIGTHISVYLKITSLNDGGVSPFLSSPGAQSKQFTVYVNDDGKRVKLKNIYDYNLKYNDEEYQSELISLDNNDTYTFNEMVILPGFYFISDEYELTNTKTTFSLELDGDLENINIQAFVLTKTKKELTKYIQFKRDIIDTKYNNDFDNLSSTLKKDNDKLKSLNDENAQLLSTKNVETTKLAKIKDDINLVEKKILLDSDALRNGLDNDKATFQNELQTKNANNLIILTDYTKNNNTYLDNKMKEYTKFYDDFFQKDLNLTEANEKLSCAADKITLYKKKIDDAKNTYNKELDKLNKDISVLNATIVDLKNKIADLDAKIAQKDAEMAGLKDEKITLNNEIKDLNGKVDNLNRLLDEQKTKVNNLTLDNTNTALNDEITQKTNRIRDLEAAVATADARILTLEKELSVAGDEKNNLTMIVKDLNDKNSLLKVNYDQLKSEYDNYIVTSRQLLNDQKANYTKILDDLNIYVASLQKKFNDDRNIQNQTIDDLKKIIKDLEAMGGGGGGGALKSYWTDYCIFL